MNVAVLVAAVSVSAATGGGSRNGSFRGPTLAPDVTLPAYCCRPDGFTIGRIGPRQRRDANANGGRGTGQDQDGGGLFHVLVSNLAKF